MKNRSRTTRKQKKRLLGGMDDETPSPPTVDPNFNKKGLEFANKYVKPVFQNVFGTYDYHKNGLVIGVEQANWNANERQFCLAFTNLYKKIQGNLDHFYPIVVGDSRYSKNSRIHSHFRIYDVVGNFGNERPSNQKELDITRLCKTTERNFGMREVIQIWKDTYNNAEKPDTLFKKAQGYLNNAEKTKGNERFIKIMDRDNQPITVWIDDIYTKDVLLDLANLDHLLQERSVEKASKNKSKSKARNDIDECIMYSKILNKYITLIDSHPNKKDLLNHFKLFKEAFYDENGRLESNIKSPDYYKNQCSDDEHEYLTLLLDNIKDERNKAPLEEKEGPNQGKHYIVKTGVTGTGFLGNRLYLEDVFPYTDDEKDIEDDYATGFREVGVGGKKRNKTRKNKKRSVTRKHK